MARDLWVNLRVSREEREWMYSLSSAYGMTLAETIRAALEYVEKRKVQLDGRKPHEHTDSHQPDGRTREAREEL